MKKQLSSIAIILLILGASCSQEKMLVRKIQAGYEIDPLQGKTTTVFNLSIPDSIDLGDNENPVFVRYDWNGDGEYDCMHSSVSSIQHRFLQKGTYTTVLEMSDLTGQKDTCMKTIVVDQGYSPPQPVLEITPDSANILATFCFDASKTHDDEDSLETLRFRFDFEGDGIWDTDYQNDPITEHKYEQLGYYDAVVEAIDTMQLVATVKQRVIANLFWDSIKPRATVEGGHATVEDIFHFDAKGSYIQDNPEAKLRYCWNLYNDSYWDAIDLDTPVYETRIPREGNITVKLRVKAPNGLYNDTLLTVEVHPYNTPPDARMVVGCRIGNPNTEFYFDSRRSFDRDEGLLSLRVRWDMDNDGNWDEELNDLMFHTKSGFEVGKHIIRMGLIDSGDKISVCSDTIMVYPGNHPTDLIVDKRGDWPEYYGTVKIGDQWWMQQNFRTEFMITKDSGLQNVCYGHDSINCIKYGGIYDSFVIGYKNDVCPYGWRLPKVSDFEDLMKTIGQDEIAELLVGGSSEMHIPMAGYMNHSGQFVGMNQNTHFWTYDTSTYRAPIAWFIDGENKISKHFIVSKSYGFYVRCIKK